MPAGFQQPPVLKLSPDYKVFINGLGALPVHQSATDPQLAQLGRSTVNYRDLNTDVSGCTISMSVESSPGTASFIINVPRHRTDALAYIRDGEIMVKPMMEVHIYLRGRFNDADNSPRYYLSFWGMVSTVQEQYSDGTHTISVSCADILHWWEITKVVTSPAAVQAEPVPGQEVTAGSSIYAGLDAHTIIYDLGKISMQNFNLPATVNAQEEQAKTQQTNQFVREAAITAGYWADRFKAIRSAQRMFAFAGFIKCYSGDVGSNKPDGTAKVEEGELSSFDKLSIENDVLPTNYRITKVRTCENQMQAVYPYKTASGRDAGQTESQQRTKLEIAQEVAKNIHWEFFLDMDGTIVFKPPFYNLDVRSNEPSVVRDIDIVNYTRTETEQGALTSMYISARPVAAEQAQKVFGGWWIDWPLALTLGLRHEDKEEWRIMSPSGAKQFAQAELVRHNSMLDTMEITIPGRPELRLGYPVYIEPLDSFYYVFGIDHTIQAGGTFVTSLSLKAKRGRIRNNAGIPQRLLAAVQKQETGKDQSVMQNEEPCPQPANSVLQALQDVAVRSQATSESDVPSGKGKSIRTMKAGSDFNSEAEARKREEKNAQDNLSQDPCNVKYEETIRGKIGEADEAAAKNLLTQEGVAPGEWVLKENHPVLPEAAGTDIKAPKSGDDLVDAIQLSDQQGYKLFGPFLYGRFIGLSREGLMEVSDGDDSGASAVQSSQSDPGAGGADPAAALRYLVNPNIGSVTLRLGSGAVSVTGAGVSGEAFAATRPNSEEATDAKHPAPRSLQIGKASVDRINNCEKGSVGVLAGADTKEARARYTQLRACITQGRHKQESLVDIVFRVAKEKLEEK